MLASSRRQRQHGTSRNMIARLGGFRVGGESRADERDDTKTEEHDRVLDMLFGGRFRQHMIDARNKIIDANGNADDKDDTAEEIRGGWLHEYQVPFANASASSDANSDQHTDTLSTEPEGSMKTRGSEMIVGNRVIGLLLAV